MLQALIGPVTGLLDKFIEDKDQKKAKSRNLFVSGWRPSVGWCCSLALFAHFLVFPTMDVVTAYMGIEAVPYPAFDMDSLMTVLLGMLGLGGMRSFEKSKGLTK